MPSPATVTNQVNYLKRLHGDDFATPMYKMSKALSMIGRDTNFGGEGKYVVVKLSPTAGGSSDFGEAVANQDATTSARFFVQHRQEYQLFTIENSAIVRSEGNKNAMISILKNESSSARYAFGRSMAARVWGNEGGSRGQIAAAQNLALTVLTLRNRADITRYEAKMWVQFSLDNGTGTSPAGTLDGGKKLQVLSVDRKAGTVTLSAALNTVAAITADAFIFRAGDYANSMTGIPGWGPAADPTAGVLFMGVDRVLIDMQRQSGVRRSGGGASKAEALISLMAEGHAAGIGRELTDGAKGEFSGFVNSLDFGELQKDRESVVEVDVELEKVKIGFRTIGVHSALGFVPLIPETDVPRGFFWCFDVGEVYFRTAGDAPRPLTEGGKLLDRPDDDAKQGRLGAYGNIFNENPGNQLIGTWA
jgi:hypothetical protein